MCAELEADTGLLRLCAIELGLGQCGTELEARDV